MEWRNGGWERWGVLPGLQVPAAVEGGGLPPEDNAGNTHSEVAQTAGSWQGEAS